MYGCQTLLFKYLLYLFTCGRKLISKERERLIAKQGKLEKEIKTYEQEIFNLQNLIPQNQRLINENAEWSELQIFSRLRLKDSRTNNFII